MPTYKKVLAIVKVDNERFVKYHVNNLLKFTTFLDEKYSGWRWFNVFATDGASKGLQLTSFTSKNRPTVIWYRD